VGFLEGILTMQTVTLDLPEDVFVAMRRTPQEFAREMRLAAAMLWYCRGMISQEKAAEIADLNRAEFLKALTRNEMNVFTVDFDDLQRELDSE
jgi:predicted HTH domain antitoxin